MMNVKNYHDWMWYWTVLFVGSDEIIIVCASHLCLPKFEGSSAQGDLRK